jgi:hypothetical protein
MAYRPGQARIPGAAPGCQRNTDMAGPPWLAGAFAAIMILTAAYSASRLVVSRLRGRATEFDADALHVVMGTAMAGMLMPPLAVLPGSAWAAVFAVAAAWFGWHTIRARSLGDSGRSRCRYPVPHLIECAAMLYMLLPVHSVRPAHGEAGMAMPGMGAAAGPAGSFPALAVVLALSMLGYIVWTTDRLTSLARAKTTAAATGRSQDHQPSVAVLQAACTHDAAATPSPPGATPTRHLDREGGPVMAPKLAACGKIAMSLTMGYMLILML